MYFSVLLLQPQHPFPQKEQKHKEVQKKLFRADIAIMTSYLFEEVHKSSDFDQRWIDGWIKSTSEKKGSISK